MRLGFTLALLGVLAIESASADDFSHWAHSAKVMLNTTSTGADVADSVQNFPLLIRVRSPSRILSEAKSDGSDLRFADATGNALAFQIERWDKAAGKGEVWVKVPKIAGGSLGNMITAYWGNPSAVPVSDGSKVFEAQNGFLGVWHLGEPGKQTRANSVGAGNPGTPVDYLGNESKEGVIGLADSLNGATGNGAHLNLGAGFADVTHGFTFSVWTEMTDAPGAWERILDIGNGQGSDNLIFGREDMTNTIFYQSNVASVYNAGVRSFGAITAGAWTNFAFTLTGQSAAIYRNGVKVATGTDGTPARNIQRINNWLGRPNWSGNAFYRGKLDEPVVSLATRSAAWLKLAYENQRPDSRLIAFQYDITTINSLVPGGIFRLDPINSITYPIQEITQSVVLVEMGSSWNPPPSGFDKLSPPFRVSTADTSATFPSLFARGDSSAGVSLYRTDSGIFTWVPPKDGQLWIPGPGGYFMGRDTMPPTVRYLGASGSGNSARASFIVDDNVSNLTCLLRIWNSKSDSMGWQSSLAGDTVVFTVAFGASGPVPQEIRLEASDHALTKGFPGMGRRLTLSRELDALQSPISLKAGMAWTLAGMPLSYPSLTVAQLSSSSGAAGIRGAVWRPGPGITGNYRFLAEQDTFPSVSGFWLASQPAAPRIVFPPSRSIPSDSDGMFPIRLVHGWNMVTSPSFRSISWPFSPSDPDTYLRSSVKRLHGFTGSGYADLDSLHPWQGQFVFFHGEDTVIRVGANLEGGVAKRAAKFASAKADPQANDIPPVTPRLELVLSPVAGAPLQLWAAGFAKAGLGIEDDPMPPPKTGSDGAWLIREGTALLCDGVAWSGTSAMAWKVVSNSRAGTSLSVTSSSLPPGFEAWLVSPARRMKYRMAPGISIPIAGEDTLDVFAGTAAALGSIGELSRGHETAPGFSFRLTSASNGPDLSLTLPSAAHLNIRIVSPDGVMRSGLSGRYQAGFYRWDWPSLANRRASLPQGISLVEISARGPGWSVHRTEIFGTLR